MTKFDQANLERDERMDPHVRRIVDLEAGQYADQEMIANLQDRLMDREQAYQHLEGAIASSRRIGAAIGIVMAVSKVTEDRAFGLLAEISQRRNRKLRLVADDIVLTGMF